MDLVNVLLQWYEDNRRSFPWREKDNSFHVLIAELFLQSTQSSRVEELYEDFIRTYSTPEDVLEAPREDVMKYLSRLGLQNKRYRVLIEASEKLRESEGDFFKKETLHEIDGVGEYIVNATLCFGEGKRLIIYDANSSRIVERFYDVQAKKEIKNKLKELLPEKAYVEFNYSLLDFGALVCKPQNPNCTGCPLNSSCEYYSEKQN